MENAAHATNEIASDWARTQTARTLVRAALNSGHLVYRSTWPSNEIFDHLQALECGPAMAWADWLDSTLDLRDGLSVVEVFAESTPEEEPFELEFFAGF